MKRLGQVRNRAAGYAMAALLVAIAVMAVGMTVALTVWRHAAQREREAELVFRGQQYVRAIQLYQRKFAAAYPPNIDVLVSQKFLRKKYADPMVADGEFEVLYQGSVVRLSLGSSAGAGAQGRGGAATSFSFDSRSGAITQGTPAGSGTGPRGGMIGVRSKSTAESILIYNGATHYNEWQFIFAPALTGRGRGGGRGFGPGAGTPGGGAGPGGGPFRGGRGAGGPGGPRGGPGFNQ
jgi:type II secretory pathway pseudopilin PulG